MPRPAISVHGGVGLYGDEQIPEALAGVCAAVERGRMLLTGGGSALAAVLAAVQMLEDDPHFNAGTGSALTTDGTIENDASVMWGQDLTAGGVAVLSGFANPVLVAEAVRSETPHVLLAADGARRFALRHGFRAVDPAAMITKIQRLKWLAESKLRAEAAGPLSPTLPEKLGTVGAVACDAHGHVAAATSTGGLFFKLPGRIGDTPIIGAGTYADDRGGAASCTGNGEAILKVSLAKVAVDLLRAGHPAAAAAEAAIAELSQRTHSSAGLILIGPDGELGIAFNTQRMSRAHWAQGDAAVTAALER